MNPLLKLLAAIVNLTRAGGLKNIEQVYGIAKRELGNKFNAAKKQIDMAFKEGQKQKKLDDRTKDVKKIDESVVSEGIETMVDTKSGKSIMDQIQESKTKIEDASSKISKAQKEIDEMYRPKTDEEIEKKFNDESELMKRLEEKVKNMANVENISTGLTRTIAREILSKKGIELPKGTDPLELFKQKFGQDILIDVNNLAEELVEMDRRGIKPKPLTQLIEQEGFFDIKMPKEPPQGFTPDELADIQKEIEQEDMLLKFDPTGRKANSTGGINRLNFADGPKDPKKKALIDAIKKVPKVGKIVGGVVEIINFVKTLDPIEAMKEVNKVIARKGKYKNITDKESQKIFDDTQDHIFERDIKPKETDMDFDEQKILDDVDEAYGVTPEMKKELDKMNMKYEGGEFDRLYDDYLYYKNEEGNFTGSFEDFIKARRQAGSLDAEMIQLKKIGAPKMTERLEIKAKYPGIDDELVDKILIDDNPQRKAELLATLDETFKMMDKGMDPDEIIDIFKNQNRTKQAMGTGPEGLSQITDLYEKIRIKNVQKQKDKEDNKQMRFRKLLASNKFPELNTFLEAELNEDDEKVELDVRTNFAVGGSPFTAQQQAQRKQQSYLDYLARQGVGQSGTTTGPAPTFNPFTGTSTSTPASGGSQPGTGGGGGTTNTGTGNTGGGSTGGGSTGGGYTGGGGGSSGGGSSGGGSTGSSGGGTSGGGSNVYTGAGNFPPGMGTNTGGGSTGSSGGSGLTPNTGNSNVGGGGFGGTGSIVGGGTGSGGSGTNNQVDTGDLGSEAANDAANQAATSSTGTTDSEIEKYINSQVQPDPMMGDNYDVDAIRGKYQSELSNAKSGGNTNISAGVNSGGVFVDPTTGKTYISQDYQNEVYGKPNQGKTGGPGVDAFFGFSDGSSVTHEFVEQSVIDSLREKYGSNTGSTGGGTGAEAVAAYKNYLKNHTGSGSPVGFDSFRQQQPRFKGQLTFTSDSYDELQNVKNAVSGGWQDDGTYDRTMINNLFPDTGDLGSEAANDAANDAATGTDQSATADDGFEDQSKDMGATADDGFEDQSKDYFGDLNSEGRIRNFDGVDRIMATSEEVMNAQEEYRQGLASGEYEPVAPRGSSRDYDNFIKQKYGAPLIVTSEKAITDYSKLMESRRQDLQAPRSDGKYADQVNASNPQPIDIGGGLKKLGEKIYNAAGQVVDTAGRILDSRPGQLALTIAKYNSGVPILETLSKVKTAVDTVNKGRDIYGQVKGSYNKAIDDTLNEVQGITGNIDLREENKTGGRVGKAIGGSLDPAARQKQSQLDFLARQPGAQPAQPQPPTANPAPQQPAVNPQPPTQAPAPFDMSKYQGGTFSGGIEDSRNIALNNLASLGVDTSKYSKMTATDTSGPKFQGLSMNEIFAMDENTAKETLGFDPAVEGSNAEFEEFLRVNDPGPMPIGPGGPAGMKTEFMNQDELSQILNRAIPYYMQTARDLGENYTLEEMLAMSDDDLAMLDDRYSKKMGYGQYRPTSNINTGSTDKSQVQETMEQYKDIQNQGTGIGLGSQYATGGRVELKYGGDAYGQSTKVKSAMNVDYNDPFNKLMSNDSGRFIKSTSDLTRYAKNLDKLKNSKQSKAALRKSLLVQNEKTRKDALKRLSLLKKLYSGGKSV